LKDFEVILIDDGSTDGSEKVYKSFNDKRLNIYRQENRGVGFSRNYAMSKASGEFIACLDSDDIWRPDKLELQCQYFEKHQGYVLLGSYCNVIDEAGDFIYLYNRVPINDSEIMQYIKKGNPIITSAAVFRRKDAIEVGGFYDEIKTNSEDYPLWVKLAKLGKVHNVPESLVSHRIVPSSLSIGVTNKVTSQLFLKLAHNGKYTEQEKDLYKKLMRTDRSIRTADYDYYLMLSKLHLFEGRKKWESIANLYRAIKSNPKVLKAYLLLPFFFLPCRFNRLAKDLYIKYVRDS